MAIIIGRVSEHDLSNIVVSGKTIFVRPEQRNWLNFPAGTVAKVTHEKGTAISIVPPSEAEMAAFTRKELVKQPAGKPITKIMQAPETAPKASYREDEEFKKKIINLLQNNPEVRAKIREIRGA